MRARGRGSRLPPKPCTRASDPLQCRQCFGGRRFRLTFDDDRSVDRSVLDWLRSLENVPRRTAPSMWSRCSSATRDRAGRAPLAWLRRRGLRDAPRSHRERHERAASGPGTSRALRSTGANHHARNVPVAVGDVGGSRRRSRPHRCAERTSRTFRLNARIHVGVGGRNWRKVSWHSPCLGCRCSRTREHRCRECETSRDVRPARSVPVPTVLRAESSTVTLADGHTPSTT